MSDAVRKQMIFVQEKEKLLHCWAAQIDDLTNQTGQPGYTVISGRPVS